MTPTHLSKVPFIPGVRGSEVVTGTGDVFYIGVKICNGWESWDCLAWIKGVLAGRPYCPLQLPEKSMLMATVNLLKTLNRIVQVGIL